MKKKQQIAMLLAVRLLAPNAQVLADTTSKYHEDLRRAPIHRNAYAELENGLSVPINNYHQVNATLYTVSTTQYYGKTRLEIVGGDLIQSMGYIRKYNFVNSTGG